MQPELDLNALFDADSASGKGRRKPKSPRQHSRRKIHSMLLSVVFLAVSFAAGFFAYDLFDPVPAVTTPPITTSPQPNFGYVINTQQVVYSDKYLTCHTYSEKPDHFSTALSPISSILLYTLTDDSGAYRLGNWPLEIPPDACNFFLRVNFTEAGTYRLDMDSFRILINGHTPENSDVPYLHLGIARFFDDNGFFVVGHLPQTVTMELQYRTSDSTEPSCIAFNAPPIQTTIFNDTRALVELALAANEQVWTENNGGLPETFEKDTMFARILAKSDCIDCLLQYAASSDPVEQARSLILLEHPAFQAKMNTIQQAILRDLKQYVTCVVYGEAVKIVNIPPSPSGAPVGPSYFEAPDGNWIFSSAPQVVHGEDPPEYNFFARLELTNFAKTQFDPTWQVIVSAAPGSPDAALCVRQYAGEGQTAGWLLYGHIDEPVALQLNLCGINGEILSVTTLGAVPITLEPLYIQAIPTS